MERRTDLVSLLDLEDGGPRSFEDIQTNPTQLVDVRVVYFGREEDFRWSHGVVVGEEQFELEETALVGSVFGTL